MSACLSHLHELARFGPLLQRVPELKGHELELWVGGGDALLDCRDGRSAPLLEVLDGLKRHLNETAMEIKIETEISTPHREGKSGRTGRGAKNMGKKLIFRWVIRSYVVDNRIESSADYSAI